MKCLKWKTKLEFVRQAVRCWRKSCNINSLFVVENACRPIKTRAGWRTAERTQWDEWLVCYNIAARGGNAVFGVVMDGDCRKNELKTCLPRECARVRPGQVLRPGGQFRRKHHLSSGWIPPIVDLFKIKIIKFVRPKTINTGIDGIDGLWFNELQYIQYCEIFQSDRKHRDKTY